MDTPTHRRGDLALDDLTGVQYAELRRRLARATRLTGSDLDEIVHVVFERLYRSGTELRSEEHLFACAIRTARWVMSNERNRTRTVSLHDIADDEVRSVPDPGETVVHRSECRRLIQALAAIGPRQREAVWLRDVEDRSRAEVAKALGVTENAVDIALHRGRRSLRKVLAAPSLMLGALRRISPGRSRRLAQPATSVGVVMVFVIGPLGGGLAGRLNNDGPGRDNVALAMVAGPAGVARPRDATIPEADPAVPRPPGGSVGRDLGVARPLPLPRAKPSVPRMTLCPGIGPTVCAGTGHHDTDRPGDTIYVIIPGSVAGGDDVPVYARQESVPACQAIPTTPYTGCTHHDTSPSADPGSPL
jgi:RNA polymerase sigma-70 factor (ECF subfamily)